MQYPQIQFYRGSLVRLASGQLKQVEDLSSDDFIESARFSASVSRTSSDSPSRDRLRLPIQSQSQQLEQRNRFNFNPTVSGSNNCGGSNGTLDENNNSVFNSPEPTSAGYDDSPRMDTDEFDEEEIEVELDVVNNTDDQLHQNNTEQQFCDQSFGPEFYIESSVVRDFLEVGPFQRQQQSNGNAQLPSSTSPGSSNDSLNLNRQQPVYPRPSTSSSFSPSDVLKPNTKSPPIIAMPPISSCTATGDTSSVRTVLIKFFLETSRSVAFIEVPIEHPFFVFHRGWSSWSPQSTLEKFGLNCRKLKIGDTCISLARRRNRPSSHSKHESDHCNLLFSSIKLNE